MADRPRLEVPIPIPRRPQRVPIPRRRQERLPASQSRALRQKVARLKKEYERMENSFYDLGKELNTLNTQEVLRLYGAKTFSAFVEAQVMPHSTARVWMIVSAHYSKRTAIRLGIYRAFHLARYAQIMGLRRTPQKLAVSDAKIGSPPKAISKYTTREMEVLVSRARMEVGRQGIPPALPAQKRALRRFRREFEDRFGFAPKARLNTKRQVAEFEIPFAELE